MTDWLLALIPGYGVWVIFTATLLSCLALPVPSSLVMLAGGGFAAGGDLALGQAVAAAWVGAVGGDQLGYAIGRRGGSAAVERLARHGSRREMVERALDFVRRWGGAGVFFSRWLVSPLGPYVNFVAGGAGLGWTRFTFYGASGEAVWVGLYVGIGYAFSSQIGAVADILGNLSGFLAALAVTFVAGIWLMKADQR